MKRTIQSFREFTEAYVDTEGNLKEFNQLIFYDFDKIGKFVDWFQKEYADYTQKQGWAIFDSDSESPDEKYHSEREYMGKKLNGYFWQVERLDDPDEDEALFGRLNSDQEAWELAKKLGLMVDDYGVVYGWKGQSFIPNMK